MAFGDSFRRLRRRARKAAKAWAGVADATPVATERKRISVGALQAFAPPAEVRTATQPPVWLEQVMSPAGGTLAMDGAPDWGVMAEYGNFSSIWGEGLGFLGYAYLSELTQRPEFRRISEIWAAECTRKWIRLTGDNPDRLQKLEDAMKRFNVREKFREAIEIDGFQGRSHIFMDFGDEGVDLQGPIALTSETIPKDSLKNLKVIEAYWCYPMDYNTNNPLDDDFYAPRTWQIFNNRVNTSRILTFVGRELPDMIKPVYMFGGLSLSQMVKPYVDNYIRNRTSVGNLLFSFSTMVLSTEMAVMLTDVGASELVQRIAAYTFGRDNGGLMMVDKETEELSNVSAPLGGVSDLLAQSLEQILIPAGIPMVVYAGTTPAGLNASSDGELKAFYGHIVGYLEKTCRGPLHTVLQVLQLNLDGKIDETVSFDFVDLWVMTAAERAEIRAKQATVDCEYMDRGVLDPEEVRDRLKREEDGPYFGVDLQGNDDAMPGAQPDPATLPGAQAEGEEEDEDDKPLKLRSAANDAWQEGDHPRGKGGQFGAGGAGSKAEAMENFASSPTIHHSKQSGIKYVQNQLPVVPDKAQPAVRAKQEALEDVLSGKDSAQFMTKKSVRPAKLQAMQSIINPASVLRFAKDGSYNKQAAKDRPLIIKDGDEHTIIDGNHRANAALLSGDTLDADVFDYAAYRMAQEEKAQGHKHKWTKADDDLLAELLG